MKESIVEQGDKDRNDLIEQMKSMLERVEDSRQAWHTQSYPSA
jgi:hypothetical protein